MLENVALTGILEMEIGGLIASAAHDWLNVSSTASFGITLEIRLLDLGGGPFMPQAGDSFDIISAEIIVGEFDLLQFAALSNRLSWNLGYLFDDLGTDYVRLTVGGAVPLPTAACSSRALCLPARVSVAKESPLTDFDRVSDRTSDGYRAADYGGPADNLFAGRNGSLIVGSRRQLD